MNIDNRYLLLLSFLSYEIIYTMHSSNRIIQVQIEQLCQPSNCLKALMSTLLIDYSQTLQDSCVYSTSTDRQIPKITLYNTLGIPHEKYLHYLSTFIDLLRSSHIRLYHYFAHKKFIFSDIIQFYHMLIYLNDKPPSNGKKLSSRLSKLIENCYPEMLDKVYQIMAQANISENTIGALLLRAPLDNSFIRMISLAIYDTPQKGISFCKDNQVLCKFLCSTKLKELYGAILHQSYKYMHEVTVYKGAKKVSKIKLTSFLQPDNIQQYHHDKCIVIHEGLLHIKMNGKLFHLPTFYDKNYTFIELYKDGPFSYSWKKFNGSNIIQYKFYFKVQNTITQQYYTLDLDHFLLNTLVLNNICQDAHTVDWMYLIGEVIKNSSRLKGQCDT